MIDDGTMRERAADQHGLVSVEQAIQLGYSERQRDRLVDGRRWERRPGRVYRLVGTTPTRHQRLMHEVLSAGPGAALNGQTALAHWGGRGAVLDPVQVLRPRDHSDRTRGPARHEPTLLLPRHIVRLEGIPVVVPARALFEIAGTQRRGAELPWWVERVDRLMNNALTDQLVSGPSLHGMLRDLAQRGRPGIRVMRQVLAKVDASYVAPASGLESRVVHLCVVHLCERAGVAPLRRQVDLGDQEAWIGRVDFLDPFVPFVLEVQSTRFHTSRLDQQLDATRFSRLDRAGFVVATVTEDQVWYHPEQVVAEITSGRRAAALRASLRAA